LTSRVARRCAVVGDQAPGDLESRLRDREIGDDAVALTSVASAMQADLVVVGQSAKMRHHLAGSLGRRLVGRKDAPVVVVVPKPTRASCASTYGGWQRAPTGRRDPRSDLEMAVHGGTPTPNLPNRPHLCLQSRATDGRTGLNPVVG